MPDFNDFDIGMLLGEETNESSTDKPRYGRCKIDKIAEDVSELKTQCEALFEDCSGVIHCFGICDGFLYEWFGRLL